MLELTAADGPAERFSLLPDERATRRAGASGFASLPETAAIELTTPLVTPITEGLTADDPELAAFWKAEHGRFRYDYVTFRAAFLTPDDARFTRAWIEVRLAGVGGGAGEGAIAWSLSPNRVADTAKLKDTGKLGVDFKFLKAEMGGEQETTVESCFLRAEREHTSDPYWEFRRTDATPLEGTYRLHLVVRTPSALPVDGTVTARAVFDRRSFLIFRQSDSSKPANVGFRLAPQTP